MSKKDRKESLLTAGEKKCAMCGKVFYVHDAEVYVYKTGFKDSRKTYFCGWGCMRKAERMKDEHQKADMRDHKEKRRISGGQDHGDKGPAVEHIRA